MQSRAGDTITLSRSFDAYKATEGWSLLLVLINGTAKYSATSTADGDNHTITITSTTSATFAAGSYGYSIFAVKTGERHEVESGTWEITPDIAALTSEDTRSHARKVLDSIEAVIEKRATKDQQAYQIHGRSLSMTPLKDLLNLRDIYRREVAAEDMADAKESGRFFVNKTRLLVRFSK